jgi:streptogramin lyase
LVGDKISDIVFDYDNYGVWFCTLETAYGGVSYLDMADQFTSYSTSDGLTYNEVLSAALDYEGGIWFATSDGVSYFYYGDPFDETDDEWATYKTTDNTDGLVNNFELANNYVNDVAVDPDGVVWFGTGYNATTGGVSSLDEYGFVSFDEYYDPVKDEIVPITYVKAVTINGGYWFGTYGGGLCFLP